MDAKVFTCLDKHAQLDLNTQLTNKNMRDVLLQMDRQLRHTLGENYSLLVPLVPRSVGRTAFTEPYVIRVVALYYQYCHSIKI